MDKVKFYENGIISCNLPFDKQTYQAQRTRSTHPKFLKPMSRLLSEILDRDFNFVNPFFDKTRIEVIQHLIQLHHEDGIKNTRSCASSRYQDEWRHDATCSQCVDRRFATLANNCLKYDLQKDYRLNIFLDELDCTHDRTMVYNYVAMTQRIMKIPDVEAFSREFSSDLCDITNHLGLQRKDGAKQIYELYKRHSKGVLDVIQAQITENLEDYTYDRLPKHCLLRLIGIGGLGESQEDRLNVSIAAKIAEQSYHRNNLNTFNKGPSRRLGIGCASSGVDYNHSIGKRQPDT